MSTHTPAAIGWQYELREPRSAWLAVAKAVFVLRQRDCSLARRTCRGLPGTRWASCSMNGVGFRHGHDGIVQSTFPPAKLT